MDSAREQLLSVIEDLEKNLDCAKHDLNFEIVQQNFGTFSQTTFKKIKEILMECMNMLTQKMTIFLKSKLLEDLPVTADPDATEKSTFEWLDTQLEISARNLQDDLFKKFLKLLWTNIANVSTKLIHFFFILFLLSELEEFPFTKWSKRPENFGCSFKIKKSFISI